MKGGKKDRKNNGQTDRQKKDRQTYFHTSFVAVDSLSTNNFSHKQHV